MSLKIAVCIKPVPDPKHYDKITIHPVTKTITRQGIPTIINPVDKHAVEAAIKAREQFVGSVTVITMAPPNAEENLREALAMGADEACLLTDRAFAGADTWATSYTLAQGLKKIGNFDLIFTGSESADGATTQVPAQLAEWLGVGHVWNVFAYSFNDESQIQAKMKMENGYIEYQVKLPDLLSVTREVNQPRYTSLMGVMKAKKKPLTVLTKADLAVAEDLIGLKGSPTQPGDIYTPSIGRKGQTLAGTPEEIVTQLIAKLRAAGIALEAWDSCKI